MDHEILLRYRAPSFYDEFEWDGNDCSYPDHIIPAEDSLHLQVYGVIDINGRHLGNLSFQNTIWAGISCFLNRISYNDTKVERPKNQGDQFRRTLMKKGKTSNPQTSHFDLADSFHPDAVIFLIGKCCWKSDLFPMTIGMCLKVSKV